MEHPSLERGDTQPQITQQIQAEPQLEGISHRCSHLMLTIQLKMHSHLGQKKVGASSQLKKIVSSPPTKLVHASNC